MAATNPAVERARLFVYLEAEGTTNLPVYVVTAGEIQVVASGPNPTDRIIVTLKSRRQYNLLDFAPLSWWKSHMSTAELVNVIDKSWVSIPDLQNIVVPDAPALVPDEESHWYIKWNSTPTPQNAKSGTARMHFDGTKLLLSENNKDFYPVVPPITISTLTYAATVDLDFDPALAVYKTISLTGDIAFTGSNMGPSRQMSLRIVCDGTLRNLTFPAGWKFIGAPAPTDIDISKTAILSLVCYGVAETDIIVAYSVEA